MKPFQESAVSFRSKAHLSSVKPPVLIGICTIALAVVILVLQSFWIGLNGESFEINKQRSESEVAETLSGVDNDQAPAAGENSSSSAREESVYIYVSGAVVVPGVYEVPKDSRVQHLIEKAGGFREDAAREVINLARGVSDGEQINVPTLEEFESGNALPAQEQPSQSGQSLKININTASASDLETLPGIGEVTAKKILRDREINGAFSSLEDIMRVAGIGEKKYEAIADFICL